VLSGALVALRCAEAWEATLAFAGLAPAVDPPQPHFRAPEFLEHTLGNMRGGRRTLVAPIEPSFAGDVWAAGVTLFAFATIAMGSEAVPRTRPGRTVER
jgi:hypothetical protein